MFAKCRKLHFLLYWQALLDNAKHFKSITSARLTCMEFISSGLVHIVNIETVYLWLIRLPTADVATTSSNLAWCGSWVGVHTRAHETNIHPSWHKIGQHPHWQRLPCEGSIQVSVSTTKNCNCVPFFNFVKSSRHPSVWFRLGSKLNFAKCARYHHVIGWDLVKDDVEIEFSQRCA